MKKSSSIIYCLFAFFLIALLGIIFVGTKEDIYDWSGQQNKSEVEPVKMEQVNEDIREYTLSADDLKPTSSCISFYSCHQQIWVYADGELIYEIKMIESATGHTTGTYWNFVEIPDNSKEVTVRLEALFPVVRQSNIVFYQGNAAAMFKQLQRSSLGEIIICFLDIAIGMMLIIYSWMIRKQLKLRGEVFYFGLLALIIGVWSFNESNFMVLLSENHVASSFLAYTCLMLMPPTYAMFIRSSSKLKRPILIRELCAAGYVNMIVCTVLAITGKYYFRETLVSMFALIALALILAIVNSIYEARQLGVDRKLFINIVGAFVLVVAFVLDVCIYEDTQVAGISSRIGMLIYMSLLGYEVIADTLERIEEGRKAELYREFAITDILTGLYNRNAYDEWVVECAPADDITLITFDLNNLKECNDTIGHAAGDRFLKAAAGLIREAFGSDGKCYRIGGDEFCVVLKGMKQDEIKNKLRQLEKLEEKYNQSEGANVKLEIAYGAVAFDGSIDSNIEDTRNRADEMMYTHKRKLKKTEKNA